MEWLFLFVSFVAVVAAGMMLTRQNAVHSALFPHRQFWLRRLPLFDVGRALPGDGAGDRLTPAAIMVLFLFVIMLLGAEIDHRYLRADALAGFRRHRCRHHLTTCFCLSHRFRPACEDGAVESPDARAQLRVINAIPGGEAEAFTVMEMGFAMPLAGTVSGNVLLDNSDDANLKICGWTRSSTIIHAMPSSAIQSCRRATIQSAPGLMMAVMFRDRSTAKR